MEYNPGALQAFGHDPQAAPERDPGHGNFAGAGHPRRMARCGIGAMNAALVDRETARMLGSMGVVNLLFS